MNDRLIEKFDFCGRMDLPSFFVRVVSDDPPCQPLRHFPLEFDWAVGFDGISQSDFRYLKAVSVFNKENLPGGDDTNICL